MVRRANPDLRRLGLVSALIAAIPGSLLAQDRPDRVLPPPSLYDAAPPARSSASDVAITAPHASPAASSPSAAGVMPAPEVSRATSEPYTAPSVSTGAGTSAGSPAAVAPAPAVSKSTSEPYTAAPAGTGAAPSAAAPVAATASSSAPATASARAAEPAPAADAGQPWYKRAWSTVTGWFGGSSEAGAPAVAEPTKVAVAPSSTGTTPVPLASSRGPAMPMPGAGYAMDTPDRTIRTGVMGQCIKTGMWEPSDVTTGCGAGPKMAKVDEPAARPRAVEPVEVQPLATPALKEEKTLEVEPPPVSMPAAAPEPEPAPLPTPVAKPAQPQTTTLSADALFALGSYQLKPAAKSSLDEFAQQLKSLDYQHIKVVGHTDPTGTVAFNDKLSKQRAESVKKYLVSRGVPASRIEAAGVGSAMPMVIETDCAKLAKPKMVACYQPDRRVDIEVHGASSRVAKQ